VRKIITLFMIGLAVAAGAGEPVSINPGVLGPGWDDLRFPATAINPAGQEAPATINNTDGTLDFAGNADNSIAFQAQLPHSYLNETSLEPHIHVLNSAANPGTTTWILTWRAADVGENFPATWSTATQTFVLEASAVKHQIFGFPAITMTGFGDSAIVLFKLTRAASSQASDTYNAVAKLLEVDIHYQIDNFGSVTSGGSRP
jgi:hypothetical protein